MNPRHNSKSLVDALQSREGTCDGDRISAVGAQIDAIGTVPISIAQRVRKVFLSNNNLQNLRHISQFQHCETLSLTHNDIKYLEDLYPLKELTSLKKLSLEGNLVTKLPFYRDFVLGHCEYITHLDQWRITDEDRVRATVNYRRACLFISRAITNAVRNALLGSMVTKRLLHNEMRSNVFARHRSLQASFVATASPSVTSLSKLVSFLKHCGIFRDILMKCEAHMSRELQHVLLKIQLSHLQQSRLTNPKTHVPPLNDDELFDKYFAQQELFYEHFLQENESVELFLGVSQPQDTHGGKAGDTNRGHFDLVTSDISQDTCREIVTGYISVPRTTTQSVTCVTVISNKNNKQLEEQETGDTIFHKNKEKDRELLQQQYRHILSNASSLLQNTASKDRDIVHLRVNEKENNIHHNNNNIRERKNNNNRNIIYDNMYCDKDDNNTFDAIDRNNSSYNKGFIKATIKNDFNHANDGNNKSNNKNINNNNFNNINNNVINKNNVSSNTENINSKTQQAVSPSIFARHNAPLPVPQVSYDVSQPQIGTQVANLNAFLLQLTSEINREEKDVDEVEGFEEMFPNNTTYDENKTSLETHLMTKAIEALQVCHESRHSVLTQTLTSLKEEMKPEKPFLLSAEDTVSQPFHTGDTVSLTELKRKIQLLSKKLILLQRHETQVCSRHKQLRHTVTHLSIKDINDNTKNTNNNNINYYHNLEAVSRLMTHSMQLKQQVSQATSYVSLCDADITLYHAQQKKLTLLTEQCQRDTACVAHCQQVIEHETAATHVLGRDVSRVSETLSNVSHAIDTQKIRQRVAAMSRYECVVLCVSLIRKTFKIWKRHVLLLQKIRNFRNKVVSRRRYKLLYCVVSQWKKFVDTVSRGHSLQQHRDTVLMRRTLYKMRVKLFRQKLSDARATKMQFLFLRRRFRLWRSVFEARQCVTGVSRVSRKVLQDTCVAVFTVLRTFRNWKRFVRHTRDTRYEQCVVPVTQRRLRVFFAQWIVSRHIRERHRNNIVTQIYMLQKMERQRRAFHYWQSVWQRRMIFETLAMKKKHFRRFMKRLFQLKKSRKSRDRLCVTEVAVSRAVWQVCREVSRKNNVSRALKIWQKWCIATQSKKQLLRFVSWRHRDVSRQKYFRIWRHMRLKILVRHTATQMIQIKRLRHILRKWCCVATQQALKRIASASDDTLYRDASSTATSDVKGVTDTLESCHSSAARDILCVVTQQNKLEDRNAMRHIYQLWHQWAAKMKRLRHNAIMVSLRHNGTGVSRVCRTVWLKWCRAVSQRIREKLKRQFHVHATLALYVHDTTTTTTITRKDIVNNNNTFININNGNNDMNINNSNNTVINTTGNLNMDDKIDDSDNIDDILQDLRDYQNSLVGGDVTEEEEVKCVLRHHSQYMATCDAVCLKWRARHACVTAEAETLVLRVATYCDTLSCLETQHDTVVASVTHWHSLCDATQRDLDSLTQCVADIEHRISCRDTSDHNNMSRLQNKELKEEEDNEEAVTVSQLIEAETRLSAMQLQQTQSNKTEYNHNNSITGINNSTSNIDKIEEENDETLVLLRQQLTSLYYRCDTVIAQRDTLRHKRTDLRHQYEELCLDRDRLTHLLLQAQLALSHVTAHLATQMAQQETQLDTLQQDATQQRHILTLCREEENKLKSLLLRLQQYQETNQDTPLLSLGDSGRDTKRYCGFERGSEVDEAQMRGMAMALLCTSSDTSSNISVATHRDTVKNTNNIEKNNNNTAVYDSHNNVRGGVSVGGDETSFSFAALIHTNIMNNNNNINNIDGFRNEVETDSVSIIVPQGSIISDTGDSNNNFNIKYNIDHVADTHTATMVDRDIEALSQRLRQRFQSFATSER